MPPAHMVKATDARMTALSSTALQLDTTCLLTLSVVGCSVLQVEPADVVMIEGILALHVQELREILNMKVYVDTGKRAWATRVQAMLLVYLSWERLTSQGCK